jgi:hypothetical protein
MDGFLKGAARAHYVFTKPWSNLIQDLSKSYTNRKKFVSCAKIVRDSTRIYYECEMTLTDELADHQATFSF